MFNNTSRITINKMKQKNIAIATFITIIVILGTTTIFIPVILQNQIPFESNLYIISKIENIVSINGSEFKILTEKKLKIALNSFIEEYNIDDFDHLSVISSIDGSSTYTKNQLESSYLKLGKNGFQFIIDSENQIDAVQGLAIDIDYSIVDIAPTIYDSLGFSDWVTEGTEIDFVNNTGFTKTILFHLDGFGWRFWSNLSSLGLIELNSSILLNQPALTAYPSITNVATASMISGFWPASTGITTRQNHILNVETIFDIACENNFTTEIIEGNAGFLAIDADYESWLTDVDDSGTNDDEIFEKTIESLKSSRADLIFTHFHGIDDTGHSYGPYSSKWLAKVEQIFLYVNEILNYVDNETLIILTADHGMHTSDIVEDYRVGIHGESCWEDMMIPIIISRK